MPHFKTAIFFFSIHKILYLLIFCYENDNAAWNAGLLILLRLLSSPPATCITIVVTAWAIALPSSLLWITSVCPISSSLNTRKIMHFI